MPSSRAGWNAVRWRHHPPFGFRHGVHLPTGTRPLQFVTKRLLVDISSLTILELVSSCSPAPYGFSYPYAQMSLDNSRLALLELLLPIGWTVNHDLAVNAEYHSYVSN